MRHVFVRFLEEIEDTKKRFRNYLTFSTTQNTLKYLTTYSADMPNWSKYLEYFLKKSSHWVSVVRAIALVNFLLVCLQKHIGWGWGIFVVVYLALN